MKCIKTKRYRCVKGDGPEDFEAKVNAVLENNQLIEAKIDGIVPYVCHIWVSAEKQLPETVAEEHELAGEYHYCIECRHLDRPTNSKKCQKIFPCRYAEYGVTKTDCTVCSRFYEDGQREVSKC